MPHAKLYPHKTMPMRCGLSQRTHTWDVFQYRPLSLAPARPTRDLIIFDNHRQQLEQRCATLTRDLQKAVTRTAELEDEASVSRAEVVRISGALHARRSTDVVDAERVFGEELQRVQETATREARALKQEVNALRTSLEQTKAKFRNACEDRYRF